MVTGLEIRRREVVLDGKPLQAIRIRLQLRYLGIEVDDARLTALQARATLPVGKNDI